VGPIGADEGPEAFSGNPKRAAADPRQTRVGPGVTEEAALDEERGTHRQTRQGRLDERGYVPGGDKRLNGTPKLKPGLEIDGTP